MDKKNFLTSTTEMCHFICQKQLSEMPGRKSRIIGVDGTCGRGNDTLWMAGICRRVYGFDVQERAIIDTKSLLEENNIYARIVEKERKIVADMEEGVFLIEDGHENIRSYVDDGIDVAMFNLGYLPGSSKEVTTKKDSTIAALNATLKMLNPGGIIGITVYWGHSGGKEEREAVTRWAEGLSKSDFHCVRMDMVNQSNFPPENFFITRKK